MAITNFQEVENALTVLQEQLNSAFARQNQMITQALNKNDRDYIALVAKVNEVASESMSNAFQKGFDPSRRHKDRLAGGLVNSILNVVQDGETTIYNPSYHEDKTVKIDSYNDSEIRDMIDGKQDILTAGDNIQINDNVISATDTVYDDSGVKNLISQEAMDRNDADANLQQQIDAFAGALIYIGTIDLATSDVTQAALDARANELGKEPILKGYVLVDNNSNDWWYDGTEWINIGYYDVAQATNSSLGVVKGSTANMKVSVDGSGEMSVNGLQTALDGKAPNSISLTAPAQQAPTDTPAITDTVPNILQNMWNKLKAVYTFWTREITNPTGVMTWDSNPAMPGNTTLANLKAALGINVNMPWMQAYGGGNNYDDGVPKWRRVWRVIPNLGMIDNKEYSFFCNGGFAVQSSFIITMHKDFRNSNWGYLNFEIMCSNKRAGVDTTRFTYDGTYIYLEFYQTWGSNYVWANTGELINEVTTAAPQIAWTMRGVTGNGTSANYQTGESLMRNPRGTASQFIKGDGSLGEASIGTAGQSLLTGTTFYRDRYLYNLRNSENMTIPNGVLTSADIGKCYTFIGNDSTNNDNPPRVTFYHRHDVLGTLELITETLGCGRSFTLTPTELSGNTPVFRKIAEAWEKRQN